MHLGLLYLIAIAAVATLTEADGEAFLNILKEPGEALCLDGSPAGYYSRPGKLVIVSETLISSSLYSCCTFVLNNTNNIYILYIIFYSMQGLVKMPQNQ